MAERSGPEHWRPDFHTAVEVEEVVAVAAELWLDLSSETELELMLQL